MLGRCATNMLRVALFSLSTLTMCIIIGLLEIIAILIIGGLISILIGGVASAANPSRHAISIGLLYAAITSIAYAFYGSTMTFAEPVTVFDWGLRPILPSTGVYLGILISIVLMSSMVFELWKGGLKHTRASISAVLGYGSATAATLIAVWIPFRLQQVMIDAFNH